VTAPTETHGGKAPYRAALVVFGVVVLGYVFTLAPTVTFWDAGEFIAASKILGIPHPPGTPLFVLLAHVWGMFVPLGQFAYRTNLMTALFSAAAVAFFFLVIAQGLRGWRVTSDGVDEEGQDPWFWIGGAVAAALVSAFVFTVWQNSNETEVYMVSAFAIAAICWLAWLWRKNRGRPRAPHLLLLVVYLAAVSLGNHLLTLLVGPALIGFMWHVLKTEPLPDERDRKTEWAQWGVVVGIWALLIGIGLGSTTVLVAGALLFLTAGVYAAMVGAIPFAITVVAISVLGASTYLFLIVRANVGPLLNEADPSNWRNLWAVISRAQYPPRSPVDNPIYTLRQEGVTAVDRVGWFLECLPEMQDGPVPQDEAMFGIPRCYQVRSIPLMARQAQMYLQYFDWQWSMGLAPTDPDFARDHPLFTVFGFPLGIRMPFALLAISLGVWGAIVLRRRDRSLFWMLMILFLTTGPGLVGYMNFKPGYSLSWNLFPSIDMHEVRERDYFFTVSFRVWGVFVGLGLVGLYRLLRERFKQGITVGTRRVPATAAVLLLATFPFALNFRAASRRHGPDATLARDFAYDLLQSAEPYGIIFTNGDNDTFPLWYIQEVEGVRQDVSVVNLSLGNTPWYIRQLRDNPVRPFDAEQAPWFANEAPDSMPGPLHSWTDAQIDQLQNGLALAGYRLPNDYPLHAGRVQHTFQRGTRFITSDALIARLISENWRTRPIYFSLTSGEDSWRDYAPDLTEQGLLLRLHARSAPDSSALAGGLFGGPPPVPVDVPRTQFLASEVYQYARLFDVDSLDLEATNRNIAFNLSFPFFALGQAYETLGDSAARDSSLRRALHLRPVPEIARLLDAGQPIFGAPVAPADTAGEE